MTGESAWNKMSLMRFDESGAGADDSFLVIARFCKGAAGSNIYTDLHHIRHCTGGGETTDAIRPDVESVWIDGSQEMVHL